MCHITLPSVVCPALPNSSTLPHKQHDLKKKVTEHKIYVLIISTVLSETFFILRRIK
jgi:hypothetical protein